MTSLKKELQHAKQLIDTHSSILLTTHKHPDGDALGSLCAMIHYLKKCNKKVTAVSDIVPEYLHFLPHVHEITTNIEDLDPKQFDLIITLDFGDLKRSPIQQVLEESIKKSIPLINVDHHSFNDRFGTVNVIDTSASSTTALLYEFFDVNNIEIDEHMSTSLLAGILTDTGNFSNSATNRSSLHYASELLKRGGRFNTITSNTIAHKPLGILNLWGTLLQRLSFNEKYNIAYTVITQDDLQKAQVQNGGVDGIANFLTCIDGLKAVMLLKETEKGTIKGSLRSVCDTMDVSAVARALGGGGHKKAAGFEIEGTIKKENMKWLIV